MWYEYVMWGALIVLALAAVVTIIVTAVKESKKKDRDVALYVITRAIALLFAISLGAVVVTAFVDEIESDLKMARPAVECSVCHEEVTTIYCPNCGTKADRTTKIIVCPKCGEECATPFCGICGTEVLREEAAQLTGLNG